MTKTPTYYCVGFLFIIGFLGSGERMNFFRIRFPPRIDNFFNNNKIREFSPSPTTKTNQTHIYHYDKYFYSYVRTKFLIKNYILNFIYRYDKLGMVVENPPTNFN